MAFLLHSPSKFFKTVEMQTKVDYVKNFTHLIEIFKILHTQVYLKLKISF